MSLGPAGLSLNPEQAENFEDVCHRIWSIKMILTINRWRSSLPLKVRLAPYSCFPACQPQNHVPLTEKDCNSCAAHDNILGNIGEDERIPTTTYENGR